MIWLLVTLLCDYLETLWPENIFNITWCLSIPPLSLYWMLDRDLLTYKEGRLQQDGLVGVNMHSYYCMYGTLDSLRCTLHDLYSFKWWVPGGTGSDEAYTELSAGGKPCYTRFFPQRSFEERLVCHLNTKLIFGICTAIWKCKVWLFVCTLMRPLQERAHFTTIVFFKSTDHWSHLCVCSRVLAILLTCLHLVLKLDGIWRRLRATDGFCWDSL